MSYLSEEDLSTFFTIKNNHYVNLSGMEMGLHENEIWTHLELPHDEDDPFKVSISTEADSLNDFITGFKIEGARDLHHLDYTNSWMRYLNEAAEITITPIELDAGISFKIVKSKTIIFSLDLHYYDEAYEHLTMPEDFKGYITNNDRKLQVAGERRYKMW